MDLLQSAISKLQEVQNALQLIEIKATHDNLQYMLASQCLIDEAKEEILEFSAAETKKEIDSDAE